MMGQRFQEHIRKWNIVEAGNCQSFVNELRLIKRERGIADEKRSFLFGMRPRTKFFFQNLDVIFNIYGVMYPNTLTDGHIFSL